jgi:hypothetical protein
MEIEARLEALELDQLDRLAAEIAQDALLTALIATHPDAHALQNAYRTISEYRLTQFSDVGFERSTPAKSMGDVASRLRGHFDAWHRKLAAD